MAPALDDTTLLTAGGGGLDEVFSVTAGAVSGARDFDGAIFPGARFLVDVSDFDNDLFGMLALGFATALPAGGALGGAVSVTAGAVSGASDLDGAIFPSAGFLLGVSDFDNDLFGICSIGIGLISGVKAYAGLQPSQLHTSTKNRR